MPTWTVTTKDTARTGTADTPAAAWKDAHDAAANLVETGALDVLHLDVDGQPCTIRPGRSGDIEADIAATLGIIADGGRAVITVCQLPAHDAAM